jgi:hypothetical protein
MVVQDVMPPDRGNEFRQNNGYHAVFVRGDEVALSRRTVSLHLSSYLNLSRENSGLAAKNDNQPA